MKKEIIAIIAAAVVLIGLLAVFGINAGSAKVKFEKVSEKTMPREIEADILPGYRDMERAIACKIQDETYVIVTRGEKPTAGYEVEITKISLERKNDKTNLTVYADFVDPVTPETMAQVISYPYTAVKTKLNGLPDKIELKAKYIE